MGLLQDDREYIEALKEAYAWGSGFYLRKLFVTMLFSEEWGILPDYRLSERISPKREDQCFEFGNSGSLAQARNGSLEREKAWAGCEILA
ncbi:hypothetical protein Lal_00024333 [Lupinus albus]|nr:hypothetical protein Lal_00024333 [Lupinus albus]